MGGRRVMRVGIRHRLIAGPPGAVGCAPLEALPDVSVATRRDLET